MAVAETRLVVMLAVGRVQVVVAVAEELHTAAGWSGIEDKAVDGDRRGVLANEVMDHILVAAACRFVVLA